MNNNLKEETQKELCSLCKFLRSEKPQNATCQLEDKEFGTLEPTCIIHASFQLNSIWRDDKEDIEILEKGIKNENKSILAKRWLGIAENVVLKEKLDKWKRLQKNYQTLENEIGSYIGLLSEKKKQLELRLCS